MLNWNIPCQTLSAPVQVHPKGCVLSPLLFTLYTNDCTTRFDNCLIIKYADNTAIVGNIVNNDDSGYRELISELLIGVAKIVWN